MKDSNQIKQDLVDDLVSFAADLSAGDVDPYLTEPEELDNRDDVTDRRVSIYQGYRSPDIVVDSNVPYETRQEYVIQVYVQVFWQKGSESATNQVFDDLCDEIYDWIEDISTANRIYTVTGGKLRVPKPQSEGSFFTDQEESLRVGKSIYTRFHIETIRKRN